MVLLMAEIQHQQKDCRIVKSKKPDKKTVEHHVMAKIRNHIH